MSISNGLKAIETVYQGYRFRSRLEARWAVFLDTLGVKYQYEPEGFELVGAGRYLPDFWLPDLDCWIEIKPTSADDTTIRKAHALAVNSEKCVVVFERSDFDIPTTKPSCKSLGMREEVRGMFGRVFPAGGIPGLERGRFGAIWVLCDLCSKPRFWIDWTSSFHLHFTTDHGVVWRDLAAPLGCHNADALGLAYIAARQARFEFGEHGR